MKYLDLSVAFKSAPAWHSRTQLGRLLGGKFAKISGVVGVGVMPALYRCTAGAGPRAVTP